MTYEERRVAEATKALETAKRLVADAATIIGYRRGQSVAALCRAALRIVDEAYEAAGKLEYEMTESPCNDDDKNTSKD